MAEHPLPTREDIVKLLTERNNWGRWGNDDEVGAINLITPAKRLEAMRLARTGQTFSLSRPFPKEPGPLNPQPAQHFTRWVEWQGTGGAAGDYYGISYHGWSTTHIDALCHMWDEHGMWNRRKPEDVMTPFGATFGDITAWQDGIITRGVLIDIPRFRGQPYVTLETPVHGWELEEAAAQQGVEVGPGDALVVFSGREAYQADHPGSWLGEEPAPGLHPSTMQFIRDRDIALLGWDLMDAERNEYGLPFGVHAVLYSFGVALLDNVLLEPLAAACVAEGRSDFLLLVLPLPVEGGTGGPVNPVAVL